MDRLTLNKDAYGAQHDRSLWAAQNVMLEAVFAAKTRDQWEEIFAGTDACVTPVLGYLEAATHPANNTRQTHISALDWIHPQIAPRLASQASASSFAIAKKGAAYSEILSDAGMDEGEIAVLLAAGAVVQ
jgi:alpha-methylacyl-CoA racemase